MLKALGYQLYACGRETPPAQIEVDGCSYNLNKVIKHDFFAATSLYQANGQSGTKKQPHPAKVILKLHRRQHFLGMPLLWLGELICSHEVSNLESLADLKPIPHILSRYGRIGFIYEYIEGRTLDEVEKLPEDFFNQVLDLLKQVHARGVVYLDMNKRGNILLGDDDKPYLIDFQISFFIDRHLLILPRFSAYLRQALQRADIYHLYKHKRRLSPETLSPQEEALSRRKSRLIRLHRSIANPLRELRRAFLKYLQDKGVLMHARE